MPHDSSRIISRILGAVDKPGMVCWLPAHLTITIPIVPHNIISYDNLSLGSINLLSNLLLIIKFKNKNKLISPKPDPILDDFPPAVMMSEKSRRIRPVKSQTS